MTTRNEIRAAAAAALACFLQAAGAQAPATASANATDALSAEQQEADLRVIAARCGTPAFERGFTKQSRALVSAGIVVKNREPAAVEKAITSMRRSPMVLVNATSDCPAQLARLAQLQKERSGMLKTGLKSGQKAAGR